MKCSHESSTVVTGPKIDTGAFRLSEKLVPGTEGAPDLNVTWLRVDGLSITTSPCVLLIVSGEFGPKFKMLLK